MTYEEAYMQCESIEELEKMVNKDIKFARWFNADRIPIIKKSAESERFDVGDGIEWNTALFVSMKDEDLKRLDLVDDDYYSDHHKGYWEDDFYGFLYFKTDVPGQYVRIHFQC